MDILREQAGTTGLVKAKENNIQKGKFKTININQEPAENYSLTYTLFFINKLRRIKYTQRLINVSLNTHLI